MQKQVFGEILALSAFEGSDGWRVAFHRLLKVLNFVFHSIGGCVGCPQFAA